MTDHPASTTDLSALVIDEAKLQREQLVKHLQLASYRVSAVATKAAAVSFLEHEAPDVLVMTWGAPAVEVVRRVRACEETKHTYVVAVVDGVNAAVLGALYQAGVDDFVRVPFTREELVARAQTPQRISRWKVLPTPPGEAPPPGVDLRRLKAFQGMGAVVARDLEGLFGPLEVFDQWLVAGELRGASIPMAIPAESAEFRVSVVMQSKIVRSLAGLVLGNEDAAADELDDMLREIANTAGGAVKRAAEEEKVVLTTGLPVSEASGPTRNELTRCWTARLPGGGQLGIIGEIHVRTNQRVAAARLQEGMILSRDVLNEAGVLVMRAGTRLTQSTVARLGGMLGPRFMVDVTLPTVL